MSADDKITYADVKAAIDKIRQADNSPRQTYADLVAYLRACDTEHELDGLSDDEVLEAFNQTMFQIFMARARLTE